MDYSWLKDLETIGNTSSSNYLTANSNNSLQCEEQLSPQLSECISPQDYSNFWYNKGRKIQLNPEFVLSGYKFIYNNPFWEILHLPLMQDIWIRTRLNNIGFGLSITVANSIESEDSKNLARQIICHNIDKLEAKNCIKKILSIHHYNDAANSLVDLGQPSTSFQQSNSFYVVFKGRRPGIYTSWHECASQVLGYSGNQHKKYKSISEAEEALEKYNNNIRYNPRI